MDSCTGRARISLVVKSPRQRLPEAVCSPIMNDNLNGFTDSNLSRRNFLMASGALAGAAGVAGLGGCAHPSGAAAVSGQPALKRLPKDAVILFQGDSITDAGRDRSQVDRPNLQTAMGNGYAWIAATGLLLDHPKQNLQIYNRGISGNKVFELAQRWDADCLNLKPDLLSILIGVNDIWHTLAGAYRGTVEIYERDYRALLERTRKALPKTRLVVCEPFVLRCGAVNEKWFPQFDAYRASARSVAAAFDATFVPFQSMFDDLVSYAPPQFWAQDGVHPSPHGAAAMADFWLTHVSQAR